MASIPVLDRRAPAPTQEIAHQTNLRSRPLIETLAKLHIIPFTPASVREYKIAQLYTIAAAEKPLLIFDVICRSSFGPLAWIVKLCAQRRITFRGYRRTHLRDAAEGVIGEWRNPFGSLATNDALLTKSFVWRKQRWQWFGGEFDEIPQTVKATVAVLQAEDPRLQFYVDSLVDEKEMAYDPFLIVCHPETEEEFYLAAWGKDDRYNYHIQALNTGEQPGRYLYYY